MLKQKWGYERVTVNYRNLSNWKKIKILCWVKFGSRCPSGSRHARIKAQDMYFFGLFSHNLAVNRSIYFGFMAIYTLIWPKLVDFSENEIHPHRYGWDVQIGIIFIDTRHWEPNIGFMMVAVHRSFTAHKLKMNAQFQDPFGCLLDKMASGSLSHMLQMHRLWPVGA